MPAPCKADEPRDADAAFRVLCGAVAQFRGDGAGIEDLRDPLRQFCSHARRERMTPERVLILVKHALEGLSGFDAGHPAQMQSIRNRIVSLAIATYYADGEQDGN